MLSIVGAAAVLLLLRPRDASALLIVSTLACAGTSTGGSLLGAESSLPGFVSAPLTVFTWMAMPLAFPLIAFAILYFPRKSRVLVRHPWLHALPVLVALPMMVPAAGTALFLAGVDGMIDAAAWDASHPGVFYASFAGGLVINIAAMLEGVWRYKHNPDPLDRRRVAVATCTLVLAVAAFTVKDGLPALAALTGRTMHYPWWGTLPLHLLTAFAGVGITYAVAVHRVLAPRVVVRQSLQYALARKTLGTLAALPATLLVVALVEQKDRSLSEIVSGQPLFYAVLLGLTIAAFKFRDRERAWLDRRFFRAEYDARAVLLSLAGRIPYETDPNELTAMVVKQIDAAMRPKMVAVFVAGVEPDTLVPVSVLHGTADTLSERGGIGSMLTWSETPLELYLDDPRSAASRLPPDEIEWLRCTGAVLFVPLSVMEQGSRRLLGALVLGGKRSDEPYSADDRQLLSSIAGQVALALDVARLRRRQASADAQAFEASGLATKLPTTGISMTPMLAECHTCQTCHDSTVPRCPHDGTPLNPGRLPRVVEAKYRVDRVLGRGGMGAVYRAHDMRLERDVAIKVVRAELLGDPDARTRFRREAQLVARLQHPGIVAVFDYGTLPDGAAFLVMEVRARAGSARDAAQRRAAAAVARRRPDAVDRRAGRRGAPSGDPASRPQAGKHPAAGGRGGSQGPGLRRRQARERGRERPGRQRGQRHADSGWATHRHAVLHGAGAAGGLAGVAEDRRLRAWRDGVRTADRGSAVRARAAGGNRDAAAHRRGSDRADRRAGGDGSGYCAGAQPESGRTPGLGDGVCGEPSGMTDTTPQVASVIGGAIGPRVPPARP